MGDEAMPNFCSQKGGFKNRALARESLNWSREKGDKGTFFGSLPPGPSFKAIPSLHSK